MIFWFIYDLNFFGWCAGLHPFFLWGSSVVNSFNHGTDRIASDTPISVPIKHAPRVRFVVAFPPKRQMSTSGLETDNRTECNVTPFIIARNAIITGKLDERISQMSTMLMRYVFMDILTQYDTIWKGFQTIKCNCQTNSCKSVQCVRGIYMCKSLILKIREISNVSTYLYVLFIYSKFLKYEWQLMISWTRNDF